MHRISACTAAIAAAALTACAVRPGLANAPRLGAAPNEDPRGHDAIANGPDSCGRKLDPGSLRNRIVPCPHSTRTAKAPPDVGPPPEASSDIAVPWGRRHYGVVLPCLFVDQTLSRWEYGAPDAVPLPWAPVAHVESIAFEPACPSFMPTK